MFVVADRWVKGVLEANKANEDNVYFTPTELKFRACLGIIKHTKTEQCVY
jgi:hypothetical protein